MKKILLFSFISVACYGQAPNTWVQKTDFQGTPRMWGVGFGLNYKGYFGTGTVGGSTVFNDFWEYDPATDSWTPKSNFYGVARGHATGFSIGTKGYIGTGFDGTATQLKDFWEYDFTTNTWTQKVDFPFSREAAVGFYIGNKGYIGTGYDNSGLSQNDFWEWNQVSNTWIQKANFGGIARSGAVGFSIGTKGYIGTGYDINGQYRNDFWEWNQTNNTWAQKASFGGTPRYFAIGFSIGNKGYIGTGYDGNWKNDFWEWDQTSNTWTQKANFGGTPRWSATSFTVGSNGYLGLGGDSTGIYKSDLWQYTPLLNQISTNALFGGSFCAGTTAMVSFSIIGVANAGNLFTAQLSDASGSFINSVNIGSFTSVVSGTINVIIPANTPAGSGYRIRVVSSNPVVTGSDNGVNLTVTPGDILNLKCFIQGYYLTGGSLRKVLYNENVIANSSSTDVDTVVVELHNATSPYAIAETYKGVLQTNGAIACNFSCNITGHSYYIAVKHRNTIQTWSAVPVMMIASTSYDFTTAANKAYGNNMIQMETGRWACYSADINQDENVDLVDFPALDNGIVYGLTGYYSSDLNGDGNIDLLDFPVLDANINAGIYSRHP